MRYRSAGLLVVLLSGCDASAAADPVSELRHAMADAGVVALFFDKELSGNRDIGCSTCHNPVYHTSDLLQLSIGTGGTRPGGSRQLGTTGQFTQRHAPELFDRGDPSWTTLFWDGRVERQGNGFSTPAGAALPSGLTSPLAAQALFPVLGRAEMRGHAGDRDRFGSLNELATLPDSATTQVWNALVGRLQAVPAYDSLFAAAYPGASGAPVTIAKAAEAIAAFIGERWSTQGDTPLDRFLLGDDSALTEPARRGAALFFGRAGCAACHRGPLLTDQRFHNVGIPPLGPGTADGLPDPGRGAVTAVPADHYSFRTPPLRNVDLTAPYFHNGAYRNLGDAVRHYRDVPAALAAFRPALVDTRLQPSLRLDATSIAGVLATLDPRVRAPRHLSDADIADVLAFLRALTSPRSGILLDDIPATVPSGLPVFDN
ncbi:MAG: cytochrome c peroxidase [Gemmatimonadota bacterium]|nr:cytochrome c peroxidase [Gemmatimonadota bacterium]